MLHLELLDFLFAWLPPADCALAYYFSNLKLNDQVAADSHSAFKLGRGFTQEEEKA